MRIINQSINLYRAIVQRRVLQCGYAESKRNVLRRISNVLTDGAVRQFSGREFQSLGAAKEKRRAAVSKFCSRTDRSFCVDDRSKRIMSVHLSVCPSVNTWIVTKQKKDLSRFTKDHLA